MIDIYNGNCIEIAKGLPEHSADMAFVDVPYQVTANRWDVLIPFDEMWDMFSHIVKPNGIMAFTATQPFSSKLVMSRPEWFRHEWIWVKDKGSNFANTVREPMKEHEHILIFCREGGWTYNKQMQERKGGGKERIKYEFKNDTESTNYRKFSKGPNSKGKELRVPSSVQEFTTERGLHPTQKPVFLVEYLIKTYTNPGETVFDPTMGSGTAMIACINTDRNGIGIELNEDYFRVTEDRIRHHEQQMVLEIQ